MKTLSEANIAVGMVVGPNGYLVDGHTACPVLYFVVGENEG